MLAYNHGPYIREAIEGVLNQRTTFPIELIIGEDCSSDETRQIVDTFAAARPDVIRVISSPTNVGMLENARRIESAARGRYIACCEGDDYWHDPDKLARDVEFLERHPDYVMTHSDYRLQCMGNGRIVPRFLGPQGPHDDSNAFAEIIAGQRKVGTATACLRADVFSEVLKQAPECYDCRFLMGDTQRWLEMARRGKVKYLPNVTATRRVLAESATQSQQPARRLRFACSAWDILEHYIAKYPCPAWAVVAARRRSAHAVLRQACDAGAHAEARRCWRELRALGGPLPGDAWLLYLGSRSRAWHAIVRPGIALFRMAQAADRRFRPSSSANWDKPARRAVPAPTDVFRGAAQTAAQ